MDDETRAATAPVAVSDWDACHNGSTGEISLSCTVTSTDASAAISGVGLMLNNSHGVTLTSSYAELSAGCESITPALNLLAGDLNVGDTIMGVVSGEADGQHYFFEQELTVGSC
jgi:hypothetical protein